MMLNVKCLIVKLTRMGYLHVDLSKNLYIGTWQIPRSEVCRRKLDPNIIIHKDYITLHKDYIRLYKDDIRWRKDDIRWRKDDIA